ncbi:MAG: hypothetical protein ACREJP_00230 [Candidatus Methylomirabilales bacterium]
MVCSLPAQESSDGLGLVIDLRSDGRAKSVEGLESGSALDGVGPGGDGLAVDEDDRIPVTGQARPDRRVDEALNVRMD